MIDILSNPSLLNPQVDFLVYLQNIRSHCPECLNTFFLSITCLGEFLLPTIFCALLYWCYDAKKGLYLFALIGINVVLSLFLKLIACVYRPWILSDKVHPVEEAMYYARSYSFPSGHSSISSSVFGGIAYIFRKYKLLCIFLILTILTVGFSRMWLGVHTPQDVISGFLIGFFLIFLVHYLIEWAEKNQNRYLYLLGIIDITAILVLVYICFFNSYPMDYVNGCLLVSPKDAIYMTFCIYSYVLGLLNGAFICRRFFPFDAGKGTLKSKILRGLIGVIIIVLLLKFFLDPVFKNADRNFLSAVIPFIVGFVITAVYPFIFSKIENKK